MSADHSESKVGRNLVHVVRDDSTAAWHGCSDAEVDEALGNVVAVYLTPDQIDRILWMLPGGVGSWREPVEEIKTRLREAKRAA